MVRGLAMPSESDSLHDAVPLVAQTHQETTGPKAKRASLYASWMLAP